MIKQREIKPGALLLNSDLSGAMWRKIFIVCVSLFCALETNAQQGGEEGAVAAFLGLSTEDEISDEELERFADLLRRPLQLNSMSRSRLASSGLFTGYQVASLLEHRQRFGDIMSFAELASVDGFGHQFVELLRPFVVLEPLGELISSGNSRRINDMSLRIGYRYGEQENDYQYGFKYSLEAYDALTTSFGFSKGISVKNPWPSVHSFSASYDFRKAGVKLILGDFNARLGQGLVAWNGAFINSLASPSGFMKKASGLSVVRSFTGSTANTGMAAEYSFGKFTIAAACAFPWVKDALVGEHVKKYGLQSVVNMKWWSRIGTIGTTTSLDYSDIVSQGMPVVRTAVDAALCICGINVFSEAAYEWSTGKAAFIAGMDLSPTESLRFAALAGCNYGENWQFAVSSEILAGKSRRHKVNLSADMLYYPVPKIDGQKGSIQVKSQVRWEGNVAEHLLLKVRLSDRFRTWGLQHRAEFRTDADVPLGMFALGTRFIILKSRDHSFLGLLDAAIRSGNLTVRLRAGAFLVDHWDDRIYVYEYDAPGSFNVPAYYGRGVWTSSMVSWKINRSVRLYFRASYISYCFMPEEKKKPGRAELKFQSVFKF